MLNLTDFKNLMEEKFIQLQKAEWADAPFPFDQHEAQIWNSGRTKLMQWVLEMMSLEEENGL